MTKRITVRRFMLASDTAVRAKLVELSPVVWENVMAENHYDECRDEEENLAAQVAAVVDCEIKV